MRTAHRCAHTVGRLPPAPRPGLGAGDAGAAGALPGGSPAPAQGAPSGALTRPRASSSRAEGLRGSPPGSPGAHLRDVGRRDPAQAAVVAQVLPAGQVLVQGVLLRAVADAEAGCLGGERSRDLPVGKQSAVRNPRSARPSLGPAGPGGLTGAAPELAPRAQRRRRPGAREARPGEAPELSLAGRPARGAAAGTTAPKRSTGNPRRIDDQRALWDRVSSKQAA